MAMLNYQRVNGLKWAKSIPKQILHLLAEMNCSIFDHWFPMVDHKNTAYARMVLRTILNAYSTLVI